MKVSGVILVAAAATIVAGCTSSKAPKDGSSASGTAGACSKSSAQAAPRTFVTATGFSPDCVAITAGSLFSIVNGTPTHQVAVTRPGAPTSFVGDLPREASTYSHVYEKKGAYVIVDSTTKKSMTLYVT